jgi:LmbE family N-acetylglucosaminyl deacetylase
MIADRILILIPHPDDEVVGCCAAIKRARAQGARVYTFYLTNGVPAREILWPWQRRKHPERIAKRWSEAAEAAQLLGIECVGRQEIPTRTLKDYIATTRDRISALAAERDFRMLWAPAYEGGHQDHDVTSFIASLFKMRMTVWEFSEYNFFGAQVRRNTFPEPSGTEQTLVLDDLEKSFKHRMLAVYKSEHRNLSYVGLDQECFRPLIDYDYARSPHAGRLFYQRFQRVPFHHPQIDRCTPADVCRKIAEFKLNEMSGA